MGVGVAGLGPHPAGEGPKIPSPCPKLALVPRREGISQITGMWGSIE